MLYSTPQGCLRNHRVAQLPQIRKQNIRRVHFPCDSLAILLGRKTATRYAMLLQDTQGICSANVCARTHIFCAQMLQDCHAITVQWPCTLLHGCRKNAANRTTTHESRTTVVRPHLPQYCNSASTSGDSPVREYKTIVRAFYGCLTFSEHLHEVCNFICCLPHGLMPAANHMAKWSYDCFETGFIR